MPLIAELTFGDLGRHCAAVPSHLKDVGTSFGVEDVLQVRHIRHERQTRTMCRPVAFRRAGNPRNCKHTSEKRILPSLSRFQMLRLRHEAEVSNTASAFTR